MMHSSCVVNRDQKALIAPRWSRHYNSSMPIQIFTGFDDRERMGWHTFVHSLIKHSSKPLSITPLAACGAPAGSNQFTLSRFLVPWLCGFKGHAIFADGADMLMMADIAALDALYDDRFAVQVVKHPTYHSLHERKYIGTEMECAQSNYERKNWISLSIINNEAPEWRDITQESIGRFKPIDLLQLKFIPDDRIGELPSKWNILTDEGQEDNDAAIIHFTCGMPFFHHYQNAPRAAEWHAAKNELTQTFI